MTAVQFFLGMPTTPGELLGTALCATAAGLAGGLFIVLLYKRYLTK